MKRIQFKDLILFEDLDYLAINKPPGISTLEDRGDNTHILSMAKGSFPDIQVCHRIDKDTSGVLVFAKNTEAYKSISLQFQERTVRKNYHAVVQGQSNFNNFLVDVPLNVKSKGVVKWDAKVGKESTTYFNTLQNFKAYSLVECKPITGRRHQIRIHLKYVKYSIVADTKYEGEDIYLSKMKKNYKSGQNEEKPIISRMALHANSILFKTLDNKEQLIEAPYPKDYQILLKQLNKFNCL